MPQLLICDEEAESVAPLLAFLDKQSIAFRFTPDGREALRQAGCNLPDLILLNVNKSGLNGFEVCEKLKANPITAPIPVILLSDGSDIDEKLKGFAVGAADFITKPFHEAEVLARVGVHLQARQHARKVMSIANCRAIDFELENDPREQIFRRALSLIESRLSNPPGLPELARAVGVNERKLTETFRQRIQQTVFDFINQRRLECSCQLLDSSSLQIRQIADQLGYRNPGDFTRAFRRYFAVTPREYRRTRRKDSDARTAVSPAQ